MKKLVTTVVALAALSISANADSFLNTSGGVGSKNGNGYHFLEIGNAKVMNIGSQYLNFKYSSDFKFYKNSQVDAEMKVGSGVLLLPSLYVESGAGYAIFNRFEDTKTVSTTTPIYDELDPGYIVGYNESVGVLGSNGIGSTKSEAFLYTKMVGEVNQDFFVEYGLKIGEKRYGVDAKAIYSIDNKLSTFIKYEYTTIHNSNSDRVIEDQIISYKKNNNDFKVGINYMF